MTVILLLATTAIAADDVAIQKFIAAVEQRRPEIILEMEANLKWQRSRFKQSPNPKAAKEEIDKLAKDIEALRRFDKKCLGLAAPVLQLQLHRYPDVGPKAGQFDKLVMPQVGEILKVEQLPSKATIEGRSVGVRSPHGAIILTQATDLQIDMAEHDSFYMPPIVQVIKIESLKTQAGDSAIIVKEFSDLDAIEAAWNKHRSPQKVKR